MADFALQRFYNSNLKNIKCGEKMGGESFFLRSKLSLLHKFERIFIIQIFWKRDEVFFFNWTLRNQKFFVLLTAPKYYLIDVETPLFPILPLRRNWVACFILMTHLPLKWPYMEHPPMRTHPHVAHPSHWTRAVTSVNCEELLQLLRVLSPWSLQRLWQARAAVPWRGGRSGISAVLKYYRN